MCQCCPAGLALGGIQAMHFWMPSIHPQHSPVVRCSQLVLLNPCSSTVMQAQLTKGYGCRQSNCRLSIPVRGVPAPNDACTCPLQGWLSHKHTAPHDLFFQHGVLHAAATPHAMQHQLSKEHQTWHRVWMLSLTVIWTHPFRQALVLPCRAGSRRNTSDGFPLAQDSPMALPKATIFEDADGEDTSFFGFSEREKRAEEDAMTAQLQSIGVNVVDEGQSWACGQQDKRTVAITGVVSPDAWSRVLGPHLCRQLPCLPSDLLLACTAVEVVCGQQQKIMYLASNTESASMEQICVCHSPPIAAGLPSDNYPTKLCSRPNRHNGPSGGAELQASS